MNLVVLQFFIKIFSTLLTGSLCGIIFINLLDKKNKRLWFFLLLTSLGTLLSNLCWTIFFIPQWLIPFNKNFFSIFVLITMAFYIIGYQALCLFIEAITQQSDRISLLQKMFTLGSIVLSIICLVFALLKAIGIFTPQVFDVNIFCTHSALYVISILQFSTIMGFIVLTTISVLSRFEKKWKENFPHITSTMQFLLLGVFPLISFEVLQLVTSNLLNLHQLSFIFNCFVDLFLLITLILAMGIIRKISKVGKQELITN